VENQAQGNTFMLLVAIVLIACVTVLLVLRAHRSGDLKEMEKKYLKRHHHN